VLAYNYAGRARAGTLDRVRFWKGALHAAYPIYLLSLLLGLARGMRWKYHAHTHGMF